jgi:hypothetical protein
MVKEFIYLGIGHNNLSPSNIFINSSLEVYFGPIALGQYSENQLWYSPIENEFIGDSICYSTTSRDIWSVGCIITELMFIATTLFYANNKEEKIQRVIEVRYWYFTLDFGDT